MRASAACQVSLRSFGVWRAGIAGLTAIAVLATGAWLIESPISPALMMSAGVASLACIALGASLWRVPSASLRWDGRAWFLDATPGALTVAIDLGPWMLLRFTTRAGVRWLPVQRLGLEAQWHALRCAVYSPAAGDPS